MTGDQLIGLLGAYNDGDRERFRGIAQQAICGLRGERDKERARQILAACNDDASGVLLRTLGPKDSGLVYQLPPVDLDKLHLSAPLKGELGSIVGERSKLDVLERHSIPPRSKILLHGPPGNGKTSIAAGLAKAARLPGFGALLSQARDGFLGATSAHLHKIFQVVATGCCALLFLDEFDALATARFDAKEGAGREQNAITSSILQMLDNRPQGIVVAATNRLDMLDGAILRRFDVTIEVPSPSREAADLFCSSVFDRHNMARDGFEPPDVSSFAAVERDAVGYIRKVILGS